MESLIILQTKLVIPPLHAHLVARPRISEKILLRKRSIIETINDQLKNISQIENSRHRSFTNFLVNLLSGLLAYCFQPKKPSLHIDSMIPATIIY